MKTLSSSWYNSNKYPGTFFIPDAKYNEIISIFPEGIGSSKCWCFTIKMTDGTSVFGSHKSIEMTKKKAIEKALDLGFTFVAV